MSAFRLAVRLAVALAALGVPAAATAAPVDDPTKPLVYVFSIDGLDGDAPTATTAPFLTSLIAGGQQSRGTFYEESRGVVTAETNTNHVAMATGAFGGQSGNPGNSFAVYSAGAKKACDGDLETTVAPGELGDGQERGTDPEEVDGQEPACVQAEDFFASVERQAGANLTTAGIFGKPKLAAIFAGRKVDGASYDADFLFAPCTPGSSDQPDYCKGTGRVPDGYAPTDQVVMDEVIRTVRDGVPADGALKRPNLTFVNLPTVDSAGHATGGPDTSAAYLAAVGLASQQLEAFVANQKALGLWERTTMLLVSDHSMDTTRTGPAAIAPVLEANPDTRGKFLVVNNGSVDMVYLKDRTAPQTERNDLLKAARDLLTGAAVTPGAVDEVLYREPNAGDPGAEKTLTGAHPAWRIAGPRTADLYVTANDGFGFDAAAVALNGNHGSPNTSDNFFAVVSGGPQVVQQRVTGVRRARLDDALVNTQQAENVDVAPTALALLGCVPPVNADPRARVLSEALAVLPSGTCARATPPGGPAGAAGTGTGAGADASSGAACPIVSGFRRFGARRLSGGRLRLTIARSAAARGRVTVDVFQQAVGRKIVGNRRVARFTRTGSTTWSGRGNRSRVRDGYLFVRLRVRLASGRTSERRIALRRANGRFTVLRAFDRAPACGLVTTFKLERPVFGGRANRDLSIAFRLSRRAVVRAEVLRGTRVVKRYRTATRNGGITHRLRLAAERLPRNATLSVRLRVTADGRTQTLRLTTRRL